MRSDYPPPHSKNIYIYINKCILKKRTLFLPLLSKYLVFISISQLYRQTYRLTSGIRIRISSTVSGLLLDVLSFKVRLRIRQVGLLIQNLAKWLLSYLGHQKSIPSSIDEIDPKRKAQTIEIITEKLETKLCNVLLGKGQIRLAIPHFSSMITKCSMWGITQWLELFNV